jgi:hypothetical protein
LAETTVFFGVEIRPVIEPFSLNVKRKFERRYASIRKVEQESALVGRRPESACLSRRQLNPPATREDLSHAQTLRGIHLQQDIYASILQVDAAYDIPTGVHGGKDVVIQPEDVITPAIPVDSFLTYESPSTSPLKGRGSLIIVLNGDLIC